MLFEGMAVLTVKMYLVQSSPVAKNSSHPNSAQTGPELNGKGKANLFL